MRLIECFSIMSFLSLSPWFPFPFSSFCSWWPALLIISERFCSLFSSFCSYSLPCVLTLSPFCFIFIVPDHLITLLSQQAVFPPQRPVQRRHSSTQQTSLVENKAVVNQMSKNDAHPLNRHLKVRRRDKRQMRTKTVGSLQFKENTCEKS